jgi:hypothetical protein
MIRRDHGNEVHSPPNLDNVRMLAALGLFDCLFV